MLITFCKSKITNARVTQSELYYHGSITVDEKILKAVHIIPGEKVEILNINNGSRIETYVIAGKAGSGQVCLNGPAARSGCVGDQLVILSYCQIDQNEAKNCKTQVIQLHDNNKIKD